MKQIYLLAFFYFVSLGYSQHKIENDSPFLQSIKVDKLNDLKFNFIQNAFISWAFSKIDISKSKFSIEIVTIYDCFNGEQASDFKEQFFILSQDNFILKGSKQLNHLELMAKCFKWRLVDRGDDSKVSEWFYFSFLKE